MTQPLGRGKFVSWARHEVREDREPHSRSLYLGDPFSPVGTGAPGLARTRPPGRREQGQKPAGTPPVQGSKRWGPAGRRAVAHVGRGHAASPPGPGRPWRGRSGGRQPGPPEPRGTASAQRASHRKPHLPAHVQQRVIVFIVQLLLAQGRRHLRNLSPRKPARPCPRGTGEPRPRQHGPARLRHSGPWRTGGAPPPPAHRSSAPAPCAPARSRAGRGGRGPPRAARGPEFQPASLRFTGTRQGGWGWSLCPLRHLPCPPRRIPVRGASYPKQPRPGPSRSPPGRRLLEAPLADFSLHRKPPEWDLFLPPLFFVFFLAIQNPAQRTSLLSVGFLKFLFNFFNCPIFRSTWPFFLLLN